MSQNLDAIKLKRQIREKNVHNLCNRKHFLNKYKKCLQISKRQTAVGEEIPVLYPQALWVGLLRIKLTKDINRNKAYKIFFDESIFTCTWRPSYVRNENPKMKIGLRAYIPF